MASFVGEILTVVSEAGPLTLFLCQSLVTAELQFLNHMVDVVLLSLGITNISCQPLTVHSS